MCHAYGFALRCDVSGQVDEGFAAEAREETVNFDDPVDMGEAHKPLDVYSELDQFLDGSYFDEAAHTDSCDELLMVQEALEFFRSELDDFMGLFPSIGTKKINKK